MAILGTGRAARAHARRLACDQRRVRLVHASRDPARAAAQGVPEPVSYAAALASARTDAVLVATPPGTHLFHVTEALSAGKDVIVEKPAFLDTAELEIARRWAQREGRRLLVAENYPYKPLAARLREILAAELVGDPLFLLVNAVKRQPAYGWRAESGALLEGGIHWVSLMTSIDPAVRATQVVRAGRAVGPDRSALCGFSYESGMIGTLAYSWEAHAPLCGLRLSHLHGSAGSVTFESNGGFVALRGERGRRLWLADPRDPGGERAMWRDLLQALRLDRQARYELDDAARDLAVVERIAAAVEAPGGSSGRTPQASSRFRS